MFLSKIVLASILSVSILIIFFILQKRPFKLSYVFFSILAFLSLIWSISNYYIYYSQSILYLNISYAIGSLMMAVGLLWVMSFTGELKSNKLILYFLIPAFIVSTYSLKVGFISTTFLPTDIQGVFFNEPGWGFIFFSFFYFFYAALILIKLHRAYRYESDKEKHHQIRLVFFGAIITLSITMVSSLILPNFHSRIITNFDSFGFFLFLLFIFISIYHYHLFNIKLISLELVFSILWTFFIFRLFFAYTTQEFISGVFVLFVTLILGIVFIRNTILTIRQREEIQTLSSKLGGNNTEQLNLDP